MKTKWKEFREDYWTALNELLSIEEENPKEEKEEFEIYYEEGKRIEVPIIAEDGMLDFNRMREIPYTCENPLF